MASSDKLCLKWNEFQNNVVSTFHDLRRDTDFSDVTLVCEEDQQIEVHRNILASTSTFFNTVLKMNKHSHPMIYMRGVKAKDLDAIVDFIYLGEANVYQDNLEGFLALAKELQLQGLTGSSNYNADNTEEAMDNQTKPNQTKPNHHMERTPNASTNPNIANVMVQPAAFASVAHMLERSAQLNTLATVPRYAQGSSTLSVQPETSPELMVQTAEARKPAIDETNIESNGGSVTKPNQSEIGRKEKLPLRVTSPEAPKPPATAVLQCQLCPSGREFRSRGELRLHYSRHYKSILGKLYDDKVKDSNKCFICNNVWEDIGDKLS